MSLSIADISTAAPEDLGKRSGRSDAHPLKADLESLLSAKPVIQAKAISIPASALKKAHKDLDLSDRKVQAKVSNILRTFAKSHSDFFGTFVVSVNANRAYVGPKASK